MPWHRSLYGRVAIGYALLLPFLLAAQAAAVVTLANQREQGNGRERLERAQVAQHLALIVTQRLQASPGAELSDAVAGLQPSARLFVVLKNGATLERRSSGPDVIQDFATGLRRIDTPDQFPPEWATGDFGATPVIIGGKVVGLVGVTPRSMFERYGGTIVLAGTGLLFLGNLALALVVVKPIRARLRNLHSATALLRDGDLRARASVVGTDELAEVAKTFNQMATQLGSRTEALETSDRLRRQLVADVSHELMTPLTTVLARLETLGMSDLGLTNEQRLSQVAGAMAEARRLERLITELLASVRLEAGATVLQFEDISLSELFAAITTRHEMDCQNRNITLTFKAPAPTVVADRFRLDQALDNLVVNAIRHTPAGGRVEIGARSIGDSTRITVWDSAGMIAAEHIPHLFDRFYKVESTNGIASPGSGLGLSIVKAIVARHGGQVNASSSIKDGTSFVIELPTRGQPVPAASAPQEVVQASGSANL